MVVFEAYLLMFCRHSDICGMKWLLPAILNNFCFERHTPGCGAGSSEGTAVSMLPAVKPVLPLGLLRMPTLWWRPCSWCDQSCAHSFHSLLQLLNHFVPGRHCSRSWGYNKGKKIYKISVLTGFVFVRWEREQISRQTSASSLSCDDQCHEEGEWQAVGKAREWVRRSFN